MGKRKKLKLYLTIGISVYCVQLFCQISKGEKTIFPSGAFAGYLKYSYFIKSHRDTIKCNYYNPIDSFNYSFNFIRLPNSHIWYSFENSYLQIGRFRKFLFNKYYYRRKKWVVCNPEGNLIIYNMSKRIIYETDYPYW